jgi:hypothetical protein
MNGLAIVLAAGALVSCGVIGAPVPPEDVGVTRTIEEQKKREALDATRPETTLQGQDVALPPLRPVGTR